MAECSPGVKSKFNDPVYLCHVHRNHRFTECVWANFVPHFSISDLLLVYLAIILRRNWTGMRKAGIPGGVDIQLLVRVLVFGVCILFGIA